MSVPDAWVQQPSPWLRLYARWGLFLIPQLWAQSWDDPLGMSLVTGVLTGSAALEMAVDAGRRLGGGMADEGRFTVDASHGEILTAK